MLPLGIQVFNITQQTLPSTQLRKNDGHTLRPAADFGSDPIDFCG
jgi:hypothetical protein